MGDGLDANDDVHLSPRQAGNAAMLDTRSLTPSFETLSPRTRRRDGTQMSNTGWIRTTGLASDR
jgi:hypothetical protein